MENHGSWSYSPNELSNLVKRFETESRDDSISYYESTSFEALIYHYEEKFDFNAALAVVTHACEQHPFNTLFLSKRVRLLIDMEQFEDAHEILDKAEQLSPQDFELRICKAELYIFSKDFDRASALLGEMIKTDDRDEKIMALLVLTDLYEEQEKFTHAFNTLKHLLTVDPSNPIALERLWFAVELSERYEESMMLHQSIVNRDPYNYIAWYNLGHAQAQLGHLEKATESYEYAYIIKNDFELAYREAAEAHFQNGNFRKAIDVYNELMEQVKPDATLLVKKGKCFEFLNNFVRARQNYHEAIRLDSSFHGAFYRLGEAYSKEGKWKNALAAYKKGLKLNPHHADYAAALAEAYYFLENFQEAESHFRTAVNFASKGNWSWIQFITFLIETNQLDKAADTIEEAIPNYTGYEITVCQAAYLIAAGQKREGFHILTNYLQDTVKGLLFLFSFMPHLEKEAEIAQLFKDAARGDNLT